MLYIYIGILLYLFSNNDKNLFVFAFSKPPIKNKHINILKPIQEFIDYIAVSINKAFSPLNYNTKKSSPLRLYLPTQTKSNRIKILRKEHKRNAWDEDDISNAFEQHFLLQDQSLLIRKHTNNSYTSSISYITNITSETTNTNISPNKYDSLYNNIDDPTVYVSAGVTQALSSFDSNQTITKEPLPPLHKQVKLSQLKSTLKQHPDYFKD